MRKDPQKERYKRNILLPEIGEMGQEKLRKSRVFVLGAGGLGSPVLFYLAAAGVGSITVADSDTVDLTNLQRQILYREVDVGRPKSLLAVDRIRELNGDIQIHALNERMDREKVTKMGGEFDLLIEASDNYETKYMMNESALSVGRPLLIGAVSAFDGYIMGIGKNGKPCFRCLFPERPDPELVPAPSSLGILGAAAGTVGSMMALQAILCLTDSDQSILGSVLNFSLSEGTVRKIKIPPSTNCNCHSIQTMQTGIS